MRLELSEEEVVVLDAALLEYMNATLKSATIAYGVSGMEDIGLEMKREHKFARHIRARLHQ
jgi:hypothetical protein